MAHFPQRTARHVAAENGVQHPLCVSTESPLNPQKHRQHEEHARLSLARQAQLRDLATGTARLRRMLSEIYPELVRAQKL